jgi:phage N-6-adenine-methyltransferase
VQERFGEIKYDLAASEDNYVSEHLYFDEKVDSLTQNWHKLDGLMWCNPPFANIEPWVRKAADSVRMNPRIQLLMLLPASVGSNWYKDYGLGYSQTMFLNPRLTFKECDDPYPRDCMILYYHGAMQGQSIWKWK